MDIQREREAFEAWFESQFESTKLHKFDDGVYWHERAQMSWEAWQAAKSQAVPEWISVKDNMPPKNILVLGISQTRSNIFNVYNVMALDEFEEAEVTHWMPLPDAPQEPK